MLKYGAYKTNNYLIIGCTPEQARGYAEDRGAAHELVELMNQDDYEALLRLAKVRLGSKYQQTYYGAQRLTKNGTKFAEFVGGLRAAFVEAGGAEFAELDQVLRHLVRSIGGDPHPVKKIVTRQIL